ncbi:hypothetical protein POF51_26075 [Brevibacillus sp. AG]|uniref:hypothetical protein n=1 Tax=Brevibacillus sp. AG TaxID=3020891 RepID=UPI00232BF556|nr:hypothetical protein [Brevibacillus sp. AG]MDC0764192.1 hypothetical protein [Brevibacillus sp. AG]
MEKYKIEKDEAKKLLAFCGYGHYPTAKIAFMGNEEGLDGYEHKYGIKARVAVFGDHSETYLGESWTDGYYEHIERVAPLFKTKVEGLGGVKRESKRVSPMVEFQARIMLSIEQGCTKDWFLKKGEDTDTYEKITDYHNNRETGLYTRNASVGSALLDLRPLPRRMEGMRQNKWPYDNITETQYMKAMSFEPYKLEAEYQKLRDTRAEYLTRAIQFSSFSFLIGIGDKNAKTRFFEQYFGAKFYPDKKIPLTKDRVEVHISEPLDNGMVIILSDFFQHGRGIGLKGLRKLRTDIIQPYLSLNHS